MRRKYIDGLGNIVPDEAFENDPRVMSKEEVLKLVGGQEAFDELLNEFFPSHRSASNIV
jgi:hypothetical protein